MRQESIKWLSEYLGSEVPADGESKEINERNMVREGQILRETKALDDRDQAQTQRTFGFKWEKTDTYTSPAMSDAIGSWLRERYSFLLSHLDANQGQSVLDIGCGGGNAAALLFADHWSRLRYVGTDISTAVDVAAHRLSETEGEKAYVQADLMRLPFLKNSFDIVFSEGVLHHTPSTKAAIETTVEYVRPGGLYAIYVYSKKSPVREFTDDYVRGLVSDLPSQEAWDKLLPLSKLGAALGELNVDVMVPEDVDLLGIPAGTINIQRLFYWHICKMYHRDGLTLEEMNHINYDWFTPKYAYRQTPEETISWIENCGLKIEKLVSEQAGHTVFARKLT